MLQKAPTSGVIGIRRWDRTSRQKQALYHSLFINETTFCQFEGSTYSHYNIWHVLI